MAKYTKEDIIRICEEEKVNFICLQFTDILGMLKSVIVTTSQLGKALDNKCMFDGASIDGFVRIEESDMCLHPDLDSFKADYTFTKENTGDILKAETGKVFAKCLEHAGVYERNEKGIGAFLRFVDKVNE